MVTPVKNMAASTIQSSIQFCYTLQETCLQIDIILGSLFEREVIDYHLMLQIEAEPVPFKKRRLLLNHLCKQDRAVILTYCDILEQSASSPECVAPFHALIASRVRKLLDVSDDVRGDGYVVWEEWEKELLQFLSFITPPPSSKCVGLTPVSRRSPPRISPAGILTSKIHQIITNVVLNLNRRKAEFVVDLLMDKDYPLDLKVATLQVGCNDDEKYIPKLESEGLALCRREECQNHLTLEFRLHAHLAWCYFTVDSEKCQEHVEAALCLQHLVEHDVLSAGLMLIQAASLAYDALQSGTLTAEVEQNILDTVIPAALHNGNRNAKDFGSRIFLELVRSDILYVYIALAECHKRKGNRREMTSRMMSMKKLAQECDYDLILSLLGDSETSWFNKIGRLWNIPATVEELLECNNPSKLLRHIHVEDSSQVQLVQNEPTADYPKLTHWHHQVSDWATYSRNAVGFVFNLFRMVIIFFVALFVHIL